jgi:hypothetical protein
MKHPLENFPQNSRKPLLWAFLAGTLALFVIFRVLNAPLITPAAPGGIVTFELAGAPVRSQAILDSWDARARLFAAFGLGLDYLFMVFYATTLMLGTLLAAGRHAGWFKSLGALGGWGALFAALLDALENYALWTILIGSASDPWPGVGAACAALKFAFLALGLLYALVGWALPKKT